MPTNLIFTVRQTSMPSQLENGAVVTLYETFSLLSTYLSIICVESLTRHYKIVMCHWRQSLAISIRYIWSGWRVCLITYLPFKNWLKAKFAHNLQSEKTFQRKLKIQNPNVLCSLYSQIQSWNLLLKINLKTLHSSCVCKLRSSVYVLYCKCKNEIFTQTEKNISWNQLAEINLHHMHYSPFLLSEKLPTYVKQKSPRTLDLESIPTSQCHHSFAKIPWNYL